MRELSVLALRESMSEAEGRPLWCRLRAHRPNVVARALLVDPERTRALVQSGANGSRRRRVGRTCASRRLPLDLNALAQRDDSIGHGAALSELGPTPCAQRAAPS